MPDVRIFGIRHHGPGSSRALQQALEAFQPDQILIEGPSDANHLIPWVTRPGMTPPVALLVYHPKDLKKASYFPFTVFSPEWQAMVYAITHDIRVSFMDLPASLAFSLEAETVSQTRLPLLEVEQSTAPRRIHRDPLAYLASLAGYSDSERWWDATFEQTVSGADIFVHILDMMTVLRQALDRAETDETLYREAWMRLSIREAIKSGSRQIAVVCGAWHAPVLHHFDDYTLKSDTGFFKGIRRSAVATAWVPWSYDRIALQHQYAAGVISPAWYALLFENRSEAVVRWFTQVARLLREEDLEASPAHIIDAIRLAETLAALRSRPLPGMDELKEAALSVCCRGDETSLQWIERRLVIGDVLGSIPGDAPLPPLLQDLEVAIRSARLSKEYETTLPVVRDLDLRKHTQLAASHILHRLDLLDIPWGKLQPGAGSETGGFHEHWLLHWLPDFAIRIIEAGIWGNTLRDAAAARLIHLAGKETSLSALAGYTSSALKADLPDAMQVLVRLLEDAAALATDILLLMDTLVPLVQITRYGSTRQLNMFAVDQLIHHLIPRICVGLPASCLHTGEELSGEILNKIKAVHSAIHLLHLPGIEPSWYNVLASIARNTASSGLLSGGCNRILYDKGLISANEAAIRMRYALSPASDRSYAVLWLEGFLSGSGLLLLHQPGLWQILNEWVKEIPMHDLQQVLPLLRRTFARFAPPERQKILELAQRDTRPETGLPVDEPDLVRAAPAIQLVRQMIGTLGNDTPSIVTP